MSYRRESQKAAPAEPTYKNAIRFYQLAYRRLDRRVCRRGIIFLLAILFIVSGIMLGLAVMQGIGYLKIIF